MEQEPWAVRLSDIKPEKQRWLWKNYFPIGDISIIAGIQGIGKSLTTVDLAARVTTGRKWPDGTTCTEGSVVIMAAEDNLARTIRPRMDAANAKTENVIAIRGAPCPDTGDLMPFDIWHNMNMLKRVLNAMKEGTGLRPRLIIIDPLASYVGNIDANRETQVRKVLYSLRANIAEKYGVAVVCVMHVKKGGDESPALERIMGSVAFTGSARCVWAFCQCPDDDDKRYLAPAKHNLIKRSTQGYELFVSAGRNGQGVITWGGKSNKVAEDLMIDRGMRPEAKKAKAMEIIKEQLAKGPVPAGKIKEEVMGADISERTCNNAKMQLGVVSVKRGSIWMWYIPGVGKPYKPPAPNNGKVKTKKQKVLSERDKLSKAITKRTKPELNRPPPKTDKQLTQDEISRVTRCVREFENGQFAPEPKE
jgi:hypothetical protein